MRLPRLYPILDTESLTARGIRLETAAAAFLDGGAGILQLRHKGHWGREIFASAREVARLCRETGAAFVVNDRADFALLLGAGLHVGQDDLPPRDARRLLGSAAVLGFSSHNADQLCAAGGEPVDYVALGPVYVTGTSGTRIRWWGWRKCGAAGRWWKNRWWPSAASPWKTRSTCWTRARIRWRWWPACCPRRPPPRPCGNGWKNGKRSPRGRARAPGRPRRVMGGSVEECCPGGKRPDQRPRPARFHHPGDGLDDRLGRLHRGRGHLAAGRIAGAADGHLGGHGAAHPHRGPQLRGTGGRHAPRRRPVRLPARSVRARCADSSTAGRCSW